MKFSKIMLVVIALLMMCVLVRCGTNNHKGEVEITAITSEVPIVSGTEQVEDAVATEEPIYLIEKNKEMQYGSYQNTLVSLSSDVTETFDDYLDNMDKNYHYSDIFYSGMALERYEANKYSNKNVKHRSDLLQGATQVDAEALYEVVLANNKVFLKESKITLYEELSKKEVKKICGIVADTINYYLANYPEIDVEEKGQIFDSETLNILIICLGVMYGVAGANNAIKAMAKGLAKGVSKKIMSTALTKGTLYPIVKNIAKWFGIKMTKDLLAGMVKKSVPVIGGVVGGGITYVSFKPCCDRLKESLQDTLLSNPNHIETAEENIIIDNIEE